MVFLAIDLEFINLFQVEISVCRKLLLLVSVPEGRVYQTPGLVLRPLRYVEWAASSQLVFHRKSGSAWLK